LAICVSISFKNYARAQNFTQRELTRNATAQTCQRIALPLHPAPADARGGAYKRYTDGQNLRKIPFSVEFCNHMRLLYPTTGTRIP
jgi:hypothetical protein